MLTSYTETVTKFLFFIISAIFIPYFWIHIFAGFNDSILNKIIKNDFSVTVPKIISLTFGYYYGTLFFTFAIYLLYPDKFSTVNPETLFPAIASAICLCFSTRLMTWKYGYKSGEQYLAALTTSASVIIIINTIIYINSMGIRLNYDLSAFTHVFLGIYDIIYNSIHYVLIITRDYAMFIILGAFLSAYFGEIIVRKSIPNKRSINDDFKDFGKFFVPLSPEKAKEVMEKMIMSQNLDSIKLITRNLMIFEYNLDSFNNVDFKVIAPTTLNWSCMSTNYKTIYQQRLDYLKMLNAQKKLEWREGNYEKLNVFIVNNKELLLSAGNCVNGVSLYSTDPYVVLQFALFFDNYFNSI